MIRFANLKKAFNRRPALRGISLEVQRGEIFGLLGHNGAGKSTAFGILLGQVYPDSGEAFLNGFSVQRDRARALARTGAIFEAPAFYDYLTGWKNLEILAAWSSRVTRSQIAEAVETVGLTSRIQEPVRVYSHGMRQRLALAQALLPEPETIILDEPTEGFDAQGIVEMRELILRLNRDRGLTVLLASHLLTEVEQLCDRIAILQTGELVFSGRMDELASGPPRFRLTVDDWVRAQEMIERGGGCVESEGLFTLPPAHDVSDVLNALVTAGLRVRALEPIKASLESLYLERLKAGNAPAPSNVAHPSSL